MNPSFNLHIEDSSVNVFNCIVNNSNNGCKSIDLKFELTSLNYS